MRTIAAVGVISTLQFTPNFKKAGEMSKKKLVDELRARKARTRKMFPETESPEIQTMIKELIESSSDLVDIPVTRIADFLHEKGMKTTRTTFISYWRKNAKNS
jgi:dissimilatory sulfite reductase (desulfoviridin) alpha/beta subunit